MTIGPIAALSWVDTIDEDAIDVEAIVGAIVVVVGACIEVNPGNWIDGGSLADVLHD